MCRRRSLSQGQQAVQDRRVGLSLEDPIEEHDLGGGKHARCGGAVAAFAEGARISTDRAACWPGKAGQEVLEVAGIEQPRERPHERALGRPRRPDEQQVLAGQDGAMSSSGMISSGPGTAVAGGFLPLQTQQRSGTADAQQRNQDQRRVTTSDSFLDRQRWVFLPARPPAHPGTARPALAAALDRRPRGRPARNRYNKGQGAGSLQHIMRRRQERPAPAATAQRAQPQAPARQWQSAAIVSTAPGRGAGG